jgi:type I restriction enzyme S subunit
VRSPWPTRPLAECGRLLSGGTPSKAKPAYWDGTIPWFSSKELKTFELRDSELHVSADGAASGSNLVPAGTVLFVVRGMSLANEFRVGLTLVESTFNQDVKAVVPAQDIHPRYLARCLRWLEPRVLSSTEESSHGTKRLPGQVFENLSIPIPPFAEQRHIADILDKADAIRRKRKEAIVLTEELLRSAFLEMFGDPVTNPKGWNQEPLGAIADIVGGGTPSRAREDFYEGTIPWATAKDFRSEMMATTQEHVSDEAISESATKLVAPGAILVVVKSKILMRRLPVAVAAVPLCFNQDVKGIVVRYPWESTYLAAHLRMAQRLLLKLARGVNTEGLTIQHLRTHAVMRPPENLVHRFAQIESALRRTIEREAVALSESESLFNGIVHRAFRGALDVDRPTSKSKAPATSSETR